MGSGLSWARGKLGCRCGRPSRSVGSHTEGGVTSGRSGGGELMSLTWAAHAAGGGGGGGELSGGGLQWSPGAWGQTGVAPSERDSAICGIVPAAASARPPARQDRLGGARHRQGISPAPGVGGRPAGRENQTHIATHATGEHHAPALPLTLTGVVKIDCWCV